MNTLAGNNHTHVDDFVYSPKIDSTAAENYARFFLMLPRLPAHLQSDFRELMAPYKLFCLYEGKWWRVTGASRMGDVWLTSDFQRDTGYDKRVFLEECSEWRASEVDLSQTPDPEAAAFIERWREVRQFISLEDVDAWKKMKAAGHQPSEEECVRADDAVDQLINQIEVEQ